jgi:hypothetical protein
MECRKSHPQHACLEQQFQENVRFFDYDPKTKSIAKKITVIILYVRRTGFLLTLAS